MHLKGWEKNREGTPLLVLGEINGVCCGWVKLAALPIHWNVQSGVTE